MSWRRYWQLGRRGFILGEGLTARYLVDTIASMGDKWQANRNGRVADNLVHAIRAEARQKVTGGNEAGAMSLGNLCTNKEKTARGE